ncbi:MAG: hypothetical protein K0B02_05200 [DPANN group archaeon]|nr:hypothetical protein [DPANN group archaeon]
MKQYLENNDNVQRILPEGNKYGNNSSDEFNIELDGNNRGIFKTFEYPSIPF